MGKMSDRAWEAHLWLSRMWGKDNEIESYEKRKADIISSLSGIGKYDDTFVPAQTGENSTETKNIEYSLMNQKIEKLLGEMAEENVRTINTIDEIKDATTHNILFDRYINRLSHNQIQQKYSYSQRQPYRILHAGLNKIREFIPDDEVLELINGQDIQRG